MYKLRMATIKDFNDFKTLFEDVDGNYEWLLWNFAEGPYSNPKKGFLSEYHELDEYFVLTKENFHNMIESKCDFPFVIEDEGIEGIVIASYLAKGIYKITCWNFYDVENITLREFSLNSLKENLPRIKRLDICATFPSAVEFLQKKGFVTKYFNHYFVLDIKKD